MGLFSFKYKKVRHGLVIDIGSGSVLVSIISADPAATYPEIIWSRREQVALKQSSTTTQTANQVMGTLLDTMLYVDGEGMKALHERHPGARITEVQVAVAAPWSYTITKSISYSDKEPFVITRDLIEELVEAARKKTEEELKENGVASSLGLRIMARATTNLTANGYPTTEPFNQNAKSLTLSHISAVAQDALVNTIHETKQKIVPNAKLSNYSFMLIYFCVIRELYSAFTDYCLVDVTYEATEMGIVRDGSLQYCTHIPFGSATLARRIATKSSVPVEEAFTYLKNPQIRARAEEQNPKLKTVIAQVCEQYREELVALFTETGDSLSVPKSMLIHTDLYTESFFKDQIAQGAHLATKVTHVVHDVSNTILTKKYDEAGKKAVRNARQDTALLLSAQFFHNQSLSAKFEQISR